jgi:hypothetical protein
VLAYATRYIPLLTEICIQNFKFELIAPTPVLNRTLDQLLMLRLAKMATSPMRHHSAVVGADWRAAEGDAVAATL